MMSMDTSLDCQARLDLSLPCADLPATLENVLAIVRRTGLRLDALTVTSHDGEADARLAVSAAHAEPIELLLTRIDNLIDVACVHHTVARAGTPAPQTCCQAALEAAAA